MIIDIRTLLPLMPVCSKKAAAHLYAILLLLHGIELSEQIISVSPVIFVISTVSQREIECMTVSRV